MFIQQSLNRHLFIVLNYFRCEKILFLAMLFLALCCFYSLST